MTGVQRKWLGGSLLYSLGLLLGLMPLASAWWWVPGLMLVSVPAWVLIFA